MEATNMSAPPVAPQTGKRKRSLNDDKGRDSQITTIQVITGSYERVLHGITVAIPSNVLGASSSSSTPNEPVEFADSFLFHAHSSSIRCLALSPPSAATPPHNNTSKRILATGGTDERINIFSIAATTPPPPRKNASKSARLKQLATYASSNKEIGALTNHSSTVSALYFPSRSKLLSASYDNTIAVTRVRDWSLLSSIRAPLPKSANRPSGDTAGPGEVPAGINAIAVHPSTKLCLSVGQGERCMRLWNLVTGKKASVLTFDKGMLALLGEGRWRGGEGRNVVWSHDGEEFAVGFERGVLVYGQDGLIKGVAKVSGTKICQLRYIAQQDPSTDEGKGSVADFLVLSTEDGRLLFFNSTAISDDHMSKAPIFKVVGQMGTLLQGNRIKDFEVLPLGQSTVLIVTGSSDGSVTVWKLDLSELDKSSSQHHDSPTTPIGTVKETLNNGDTVPEPKGTTANIVGDLLGTCQTSQRITCISAFIMDNSNPADDTRDNENGSEEEGNDVNGGEAEEEKDSDNSDDDEDDDDDD